MERNMQLVWVNVSEDEQGWRPYFTVINEGGQMIMYIDKAMTQMSHSIDLKLWDEDQLSISTTKSVHRSFRMTFNTKEGAFRFAFEKEEHQRAFIKKVTPFLAAKAEEKEENKKYQVVHVKLSSKSGVIQEFEDEAMTALIREIRLDDVAEDGVNVVDNRVVLKLKGQESQYNIRIKDEETRNNVMDQIRHQIEYRKEFKNILKMYHPNIKLFENVQVGDHCNGKGHGDISKCGAMQRVCAALDFYSFLMLSPFPEVETKSRNELFEDFMDQYYPKRLFFNDYIHWTTYHRDEESVMNLRKHLQFVCDSAKNCGATSRHYSDRQVNAVGPDGVPTHWAKENMDSYHFNIYHLGHLGLRVTAEFQESLQALSEEGKDESELLDVSAKKMSQFVGAKSADYTTERLDGVKNKKFNINVSETNPDMNATKKHGTNKVTMKKKVLKEISKVVDEEKILREFSEFAEKHDVDTDCIEDDIDIFEEEKDSNLFQTLQQNLKAVEVIQALFRHQRIMSKSFATGYPLFYWKWYTTATSWDIERNLYLSSYMDLGGRSVQELSVSPHFDNIKAEVLATGLVGPEMFEKLVVQKANNYLESDQCRNMTCKFFHSDNRWEVDPLHFGFDLFYPLAPQHLHSIIIYCDFTELCTLFSESLREMEAGDCLEDIKKRNEKFFYLTKALRELVTYFGSDGGGDYGSGRLNGVVKGPFFSGVSVVLNLSEFSIGFNTPTSTTKTKEIAWRFAGEEGMVITVGNQKGKSRIQPLFNATWISNFVEEDEYLWFGSVFKLSVESICVVASSRNYRRSMTALYLFAAALTGQYLGEMEVKKEDVEILAFCLKHVRNEELPPKPQCVDEYVLDSMYCFTQSVTKLTVEMASVNRFSVAFQELIFYGLTEQKCDLYDGPVIPKDETNLPRRDLLCLFPNCVELELWTSNEGNTFVLNLEALLLVLGESMMSPSFKRVKIRDRRQTWIGHPRKSFYKAVTSDVVKKYKAKNFVIQSDRIRTDDDGTYDSYEFDSLDFDHEDWIMIEPDL